MQTLELPGIIALAHELHAGQLDKSGRPYISHPERVADMVRHSGGIWAQEQAAWLHDSIEDTDATAEFLRGRGVAGIVVEMVEVLTHPKGEPNWKYWDRIRMNEPCRLIKLCDIYDNLSPARSCYLDQETQTRLIIKYADALAALA